jgi:hypothetical protein
MCCLITSLFMLGPRAAVVVWWLLDPARWNLAFASWIWPILGFLFAPWTTLMYVIVAPGGVNSLDWIWIALGVAADIASWTGGAYGNRDRVPGSSQRA